MTYKDLNNSLQFQTRNICTKPMAVKKKAPRYLAPTTSGVAKSDSMDTIVALNPYDIAVK